MAEQFNPIATHRAITQTKKTNMKKLILVLGLLGFTWAAQAQKEGSRLAIGLKTGFNTTRFNLSNIADQDKEDWKTETKSGFIYGGFVRIKLAHPLYLQPELYYGKKKFEIDRNKVELKTLDVPILLNLRLLSLGPVRIYGVGGPVASIVRQNKLPQVLEDEGVDFKKTNWTFQAGGGVEVWRISVDARYEWGLSKVSEGLFDGKTNVFTMTAGFRLFGR